MIDFRLMNACVFDVTLFRKRNRSKPFVNYTRNTIYTSSVFVRLIFFSLSFLLDFPNSRIWIDLWLNLMK
jgi:hypothetical protein